MTDTSVRTPSRDLPRARVNAGAGLWTSSVIVAKRVVRRFARSPQLIVFSTIQAAIFLLMFRYGFGGAIDTGNGSSYVHFLVPGFIATNILWAGMAAAVGVAEDIEHGFVDRLRSLPMSRAAVLIGRSIADSALLVWALGISTVMGFIVGFRMGGSIGAGLAAFGLCLVFGFAFEWVFITVGLVAGTAQGAQQMGMLVTPLVFLSSAYVPVESMPVVVKQFAEFQPLTPMVNAVRSLAMGPDAEGLFEHSTGYYVGISLLWAAGIFLVFGFLAIRRFARS